MEDNPEAQKLLRSASTNNTFAGILSFTGSFLIGWNLGEAISNKDPNWALSAIGAGCIIGSIPLYTSAGKKARQSVELYNSGLKKTTGLRNTELYLGLAVQKIGLSLNF